MKISVQLYSIRGVGDFSAQLALAQRTGFQWVETVATHNLSPQAFAANVAEHGLKVSSMHTGLRLLDTQREHIIEACRLTGCPLVIMPWMELANRPLTGEGWSRLGGRLAAIGRELAPHGIGLAYHNHDFEFFPYEGKIALEWLFADAAPADLGWEADLGWVRRAGADPKKWIERLRPYLSAVHAKDIAGEGKNVDEDGWCVLGQGMMNWRDLLVYLKDKVDVIIFEHDAPKEHEATLRDSFTFMRSTLG
jgi:sugar phosphate isomerase/epimerase